MALTTLANAKSWIGIPSGSTGDDALLTRLIDAVSALFGQITSREFLTGTYTEQSNGTGRNFTLTKNYPVRSVSSVTINGSVIPQSTNYSMAGWYLDGDVIRTRGYSFQLGDGNVEISYTAGYDVIPSDLEQACVEAVGMRYRERTRAGQSSQSTGGENASYESRELPAFVQKVLDQYKRVTMD